MLKPYTKEDAMRDAGLEYNPDPHNNAEKLSQLAAKSMNRQSTTVKEFVANGGMPTKTTPAPAGKRVDRTDTTTNRSTPESLHREYLAHLSGSK